MHKLILLITICFGFNTLAAHKTLCGGGAIKERRGIYENDEGKKIHVCVEEIACTEFELTDNGYGAQVSSGNPITSLRKVACRPDSDDNSCPVGDECIQDHLVPEDEVENIKLIKRHSSHKTMDADDTNDDSNSNSNNSKHSNQGTE
jgi:hypothetical protein